MSGGRIETAKIKRDYTAISHEVILRVLFKPNEFFEDKSKVHNMRKIMIFLCVLILTGTLVIIIFGFLSLLICPAGKPFTESFLELTFSSENLLIAIFWGFITMFILYLTSSHIIFSRFGGRGKPIDTFKAAVYSITPMALLELPLFSIMVMSTSCGISFFNFFRILYNPEPHYFFFPLMIPLSWSIALFVYASGVFHRTGIRKSFLCLLPHIIFIIIVLTFLNFFLTAGYRFV